MTEKYKCAVCGGVFERTTPEDEARAELKEFFGDVSVDDCDIVCDDCWEKVRPDKHGFDLPVSEEDLKGQTLFGLPIVEMDKKDEVDISGIKFGRCIFQKPKWLRSRYQLKKHIKKRFIEEMAVEHLKVLMEEEVKIIFGDSKLGGKPVGILNAESIIKGNQYE